MGLFFSTILSFPTIIYTFLMCVALLFWGVAAVGLLDIDCLDFTGHESHVGNHLDIDSHHLEGGWFAGLLMKLGLDSVPVTIILTVLFFFSWVICYFLQLFTSYVPLGILRFPVGIIILLFSVFPAAYLTGWSCKPVRIFFKKLQDEQQAISAKHIIGHVAVVRSGSVSDTFGEADFDDKGAGLILRIRADESSVLTRGDRVILIEYLEDGAYKVVSEEEFKGI